MQTQNVYNATMEQIQAMDHWDNMTLDQLFERLGWIYDTLQDVGAVSGDPELINAPAVKFNTLCGGSGTSICWHLLTPLIASHCAV